MNEATRRFAGDRWLHFNSFSKNESELSTRSINKLVVSQSLRRPSMQNMSFLDFSALSQQIMGSINVTGNLHNASYIKEIKLWCERGIKLDVIF